MIVFDIIILSDNIIIINVNTNDRLLRNDVFYDTGYFINRILIEIQ